jgi:hypothetical protein
VRVLQQYSPVQGFLILSQTHTHTHTHTHTLLYTHLNTHTTSEAVRFFYKYLSWDMETLNQLPVRNHHEAQLRVTAITDDQIRVEEFSLFLVKQCSEDFLLDNENEQNNHICVVLGLPAELTSQELHSFLEPYLHEIMLYRVVVHIPEQRTVYADIRRSCSLLIKFACVTTCKSFIDIYNSLQFPSHRNIPPCLIVPLARVEMVLSDGFDYLAAEGVNAFPVIEQFCQPSDNAGENAAEDPTGGVIVEKFELPTCCVCLRRIKSGVSKVFGSNDVPVFTHLFGNEGRCQVRSYLHMR